MSYSTFLIIWLFPTDNLAVSAQGFRRGANRVRKVSVVLSFILPDAHPPLEYVVSLFVSLFNTTSHLWWHQVEGYEGGRVLSCETGVLTCSLDAYHYRPRGGHHHRHHCRQYRKSNTTQIVVGTSSAKLHFCPLLMLVVSMTRLSNFTRFSCV